MKSNMFRFAFFVILIKALAVANSGVVTLRECGKYSLIIDINSLICSSTDQIIVMYMYLYWGRSIVKFENASMKPCLDYVRFFEQKNLQLT